MNLHTISLHIRFCLLSFIIILEERSKPCFPSPSIIPKIDDTERRFAYIGWPATQHTCEHEAVNIRIRWSSSPIFPNINTHTFHLRGIYITLTRKMMKALRKTPVWSPGRRLPSPRLLKVAAGSHALTNRCMLAASIHRLAPQSKVDPSLRSNPKQCINQTVQKLHFNVPQTRNTAVLSYQSLLSGKCAVTVRDDFHFRTPNIPFSDPLYFCFHIVVSDTWFVSSASQRAA